MSRAALVAATLLVVVTQPARAQQLSGTVLDASTGHAVGGAAVRFVVHPGSDVSDSRGRFTLTWNDEPDTVSVRLVGYSEARVAVVSGVQRLTIRLVPAATELAELVSVAGHRPQRSAEIVLPVTVVTQEEIAASGALAIDQLLQEMPGVQQLSSPPATSTLSIRGIGGSRVLLLVDGVEAPGSLLEDHDVSRLSTSSLQQVEVIRGPVAVMHGSQAMGGVINLVTRTPEGPLTVVTDLATGSGGRRNALLEASAGGVVPWRLSAAWRSEDRISSQLEREGARHRVLDLRGTARRALSSSTTMRADFSLMRERQRWPLGGGFHGFGDNQALAGWIEARHSSSNGDWQLRASAHEYRHRYREALGLDPFANTGTPTQLERSGQLMLTRRQRVGVHELDAGVQTALHEVTAADRLLGGRLDDRTVDVWLQDGISLGRWLATVAARQSWSSRWGSSTTPSVGLAWEPASRLRLRTGIARGFRGPSFKELGWTFANVAAGYLIAGNPDLVPESSWQYFAGLTWAPLDAVTLELDLHRNELREMIDLQESGTTGDGIVIYSPANVSRALTEGIDVSLRWQRNGAAASLAWSALNTADLVTGLPLPRRVPHSIRLMATRDISDAFTVHAAGRWSAAVPDYQSDFLAWDATAALRLSGGLELSAGMDNIFDSRPSGWLTPVGRTVRVGLRGNLVM